MSHHDPTVSRREFLTRSLAGLALAALPEWYVREAVAAEKERHSQRRTIGPNDKIAIACIGPGGSKGGYQQGLNDTRSAQGHPGTQIVAVCDVDRQHRDEAAQKLGPDCKPYSDFRELLASDGIDAVVIGTPDHWHAQIAIAAMKAGKDVYCEKPLTLTIDEGKKLVQAWKSTGAVFQTGSQQRSDARFRMACELVRNGRIGKIKQVRTQLPTGPTGGPFTVKPIPDGFDWDFWLGPTPKTEYVPERTHGTFRWWLEYSGGMMTDWGAHHNDIAQWGLGMDRSGPVSVEAKGKHAEPQCDECYNTFPAFEVHYTYADGTPLICTNEGENGVQFEGEDGWIFVSRETIRASDERLLKDPLPSTATRLYASNDHMGNFLEGVRSRKQPICDAEIGYRSVSVCHLGNISLRLGGRKLEWDPKKEQFKGDKEASAMLSRPRRGPWKL